MLELPHRVSRDGTACLADYSISGSKGKTDQCDRENNYVIARVCV